MTVLQIEVDLPAFENLVDEFKKNAQIYPDGQKVSVGGTEATLEDVPGFGVVWQTVEIAPDGRRHGMLYASGTPEDPGIDPLTTDEIVERLAKDKACDQVEGELRTAMANGKSLRILSVV